METGKSERVLGGAEKAAMFLLALGEDAASAVLRHMNSREVYTVTTNMAKVSSPSPAKVADVIREFGETTVATGGFSNLGGEDYVKKILVNSLGEEKAQQMLESIQTEADALESLNWIEPKMLAGFLRHEHPQTIAIVLSYLEPSLTSQILPLLREDNMSDVVLRMATLEQVPAGVLRELGEVLRRELSSGTRARSSGGVQTAADVLNYADGKTEEKILAEIEQVNPELVESIRRKMFLFEDLIKIDNKAIQEILKEVSRDVLTVALKGTEAGIREKFFGNMSERAADILREDMEDKGPVRLSDVEAAQAELLKTAKLLESQGRIILKTGEGGGDALVD